MGCQCARYEEVNSEPLNDPYLTYIKSLISTYPVIIYSQTTCKRSSQVKELMKENLIAYEYFEIDNLPDPKEVSSALTSLTGRGKCPYVFVNGRFVGGLKKTKKEIQEGKFNSKEDKQ